MNTRSLVDTLTIGTAGVSGFLASRQPITDWYLDFAIKHYEIHSKVDAVLTGAHVGAVGLLAATAVGVGAGYIAKRGLEYKDQQTERPQLTILR